MKLIPASYVDKISIISQDDDQYGLTSKLCEEIGLVKINNPKKALGQSPQVV